MTRNNGPPRIVEAIFVVLALIAIILILAGCGEPRTFTDKHGRVWIMGIPPAVPVVPLTTQPARPDTKPDPFYEGRDPEWE